MTTALASQEMTLDQWCERLPPHHRVNIELKALREALSAMPTEELPYISSHRLAEWAVESARQPGTWEEKAADFLHENTLREASGISIDEMYALCLAIERIQASEEQTFVSVNAARLLGKLKAIVSPQREPSDG